MIRVRAERPGEVLESGSAAVGEQEQGSRHTRNQARSAIGPLARKAGCRTAVQPAAARPDRGQRSPAGAIQR